MRVLFVADVTGSSGMRVTERQLRRLKKEEKADFVVVKLSGSRLRDIGQSQL